MNKKIISFSLFVISFILFTFNTYSANSNNGHFSLYCDNTDVQVDKNFSVKLVANLPQPDNISTFRLTLEFDSSKFTFKSISPKNITTSSEFKYSIKGNVLTVIYLTSNQGIDIVPNSDTEICLLNFKVNNNCDICSSTMSAKLDGISDYDINEIIAENPAPLTINIVDKILSDCTLKMLVPSEGTLHPTFSPQVYDYDLNVPYSTKSIEFDAIPNDENSSVKINRKNLNSAGTSTSIKITVKNNTTKDTCIYNVNVHRDSKPISNTTKNDNLSSSVANNVVNKNNSSNSSSRKIYNNSNNNVNSTDDSYETDYDNYSKNSDTNNFHNSKENNNTDNIDTDESTKDCISSVENTNSPDDKNNYISKTIIVKENKFNIFFAGVCLSCLLFIIGYIIYNKLSSHISNNKNNLKHNI